jgi:hypothetical protein
MIAGFKRKIGMFTATSGPAAFNLNLGFVPDEFVMKARQATGAKIAKVAWQNSLPSGYSFVDYNVVDSATTGNMSSKYVTTGGITAWETTYGTALKRWNSLVGKDTNAGAVATAVIVGQCVTPTTLPAGYNSMPVFKCTTAGSTGTTEPTWTYTVGDTVSDSGVTWTCIDSGTAPSAQSALGYGYPPVVGDSAAAEGKVAGKGVTIPAAMQDASGVYDYIATFGTI